MALNPGWPEFYCSQLSEELHHKLWRAGYLTFEQIAQATDDDLRRLGFGATRIKYIRAARPLIDNSDIITE